MDTAISNNGRECTLNHLSLIPSSVALNDAPVLQPMNESDARRQLEAAIDAWLGGQVSPPELLRVKAFLTFSVTGPNLALEHSMGPTADQLAGMPETIWDAMSALADANQVVINCVFFPPAMKSLPAGLTKIHALQYLDLPDFAGACIDLSALTPTLNDLIVNLRGAKNLQAVHCQSGTKINLAKCSCPTKVYFHDAGLVPRSKAKFYPADSRFKDTHAAVRTRNDIAHINESLADRLPLGQAVRAVLDSANALAIHATMREVLSSKLTVSHQTQLLMAPDKNWGYPALAMMLGNGKPQCVEHYVRAILASSWPLEEQFDLLLAEFGPRKVRYWNLPTGFSRAFANGRCEMLAAYGRPILESRLPDDKKCILLAARNHYGSTGLHYAFSGNRVDMIVDYDDLILASSLPLEEKTILLEAKDEKGVPGLYIAFQKNAVQAVEMRTRIILNSALPDDYKLRLLSARNPLFDSEDQIDPDCEVSQCFKKLIRESNLPASAKNTLLEE